MIVATVGHSSIKYYATIVDNDGRDMHITFGGYPDMVRLLWLIKSAGQLTLVRDS